MVDVLDNDALSNCNLRKGCYSIVRHCNTVTSLSACFRADMCRTCVVRSFSGILCN